MWRVHSVNVPGYYKPVLTKKSDSGKTKFYRIHDEWLLAFFHKIEIYCKMFVAALVPFKHNINKRLFTSILDILYSVFARSHITLYVRAKKT